ncbi:hypothetical protein LYZ37_22275 [Vibrio tubiashii]|uniref:hypothetical protein n=1 Tax=Vibrio tubiashii TaxID=29498 RepID=UPI00234EC652|nr:hypothetical protein [Vibrio tubiashii]WCP69250.1 hypothetical protein LYZ37_22275 [Vibrio tubiashii]
MVLKHSSIALAIAVALTACGGSDSDTMNTNSESSSTSTTSLTARAADGYLIGANACLDLNNNKVCESSEPNAVTSDNGEFTLTGLTAEQIAQGVLLIEVIAGQTIDSDNPSVVLSKGYNLTAPPGSDFVSPLTTMIQNEVEKGSTLDEAKSKVQQKLGSTIDVTKDYIAAKNSSSLSDEEKTAFASLHKVAQVTANIMASKTDSLKQASANAGISDDELISLIIEEVTIVLENVVSKVAQNGNSFDPTSIADEIDRDHINLDVDNLRDKVKENEAVKNSAKVDLATLISEQGISWFSSQSHTNKPLTLDYGYLKREADGSVTSTEYGYDYARREFIRSTGQVEDILLLDQVGWSSLNDSVAELVLNPDKTVTFVKGSSVLSQTASAQKVNIGGLNVSAVLAKTAEAGAWANVVPSDLVFPDNTTAYKLKTDFVNKGYYGFNKGNWCNDLQRYTELNNMCNGVSANNVSSWLTTLESTLAQDSSDRTGTVDTSGMPVMGELDDGVLYAQLLPSGSIAYYKGSYDGETPLVRYSQTGQWKDLTVHGETLRQVTLPKGIASQASWHNYNPADNSVYFTVVDNFVRVAWFMETINRGEPEYVFDVATKEFILENYAQPLNLQACLDSLPDSHYQPKIGDKINYKVTRTLNQSMSTNFDFRLEYLGSNFSWLNDVTEVTGLPTWIADWTGTLSKSKLSIYDQNGNLNSYELMYSTNEHYLGQEGFNPQGELLYGTAKVGLPPAVAHSSKLLGVEKTHTRAVNAPLTVIFDDSKVPAQLVTHGLRSVDSETTLNSITEAWPMSAFDYSETYLGKERISVPAGTFDACKLTSKTHYPGVDETDSDVTWLINKGYVKKERVEPSWNAVMSLEAREIL